jgi:hypothetical protein
LVLGRDLCPAKPFCPGSRYMLIPGFALALRDSPGRDSRRPVLLGFRFRYAGSPVGYPTEMTIHPNPWERRGGSVAVPWSGERQRRHGIFAGRLAPGHFCQRLQSRWRRSHRSAGFHLRLLPAPAIGGALTRRRRLALTGCFIRYEIRFSNPWLSGFACYSRTLRLSFRPF